MPKAFVVSGEEIPAGKYALFTIPGKKEWTIVINMNWEQHLASEYDEKDNIVRVKVKPGEHEHTERLQYIIETSQDSTGVITILWEKIKVELLFKLKK